MSLTCGNHCVFSQQVLRFLTMGEGKDVFGFFISPYSSSSGFPAVPVAGTLWKAVPAPLIASHQAAHWGFAKVMKEHWSIKAEFYRFLGLEKVCHPLKLIKLEKKITRTFSSDIILTAIIMTCSISTCGHCVSVTERPCCLDKSVLFEASRWTETTPVCPSLS